MDFKDCIKQLSDRVAKLKEQLQTEEATKNAFVMPFIQILGYDVFNPMEVVPEMDCDIIKKKGDKIDYAIMKDGEPIILFECKNWSENLDIHSTQLRKYYVASKAKFGVLTNGIIYRFYTDLEKENLMDDVPFLEVDMENVRDSQIEELKKFHKSYFDIENILSSAEELKYMAELKSVIKSEFYSPSSDFTRFLAKKVYSGTITQKVVEQFYDLVKRAISGHINDVMSERLNMAMKSSEDIDSSKSDKVIVIQEEQPDSQQSQENKIITTEEEKEGFYIVKSIVIDILKPERVKYRDSLSYFTILCDNTKKVICRLYFNSSKKYIGIQSEDRKELKHRIESLNDIYTYRNELIEAAKMYV